MSDREACIANPHTLTPSAPLTFLHLHLLLAPCTWACRKPSKQQGDNKSLLGGGFNLHASLAALSVMPLIPFYLLNISCKFFLPSEHKLLGKQYTNFWHSSQITPLLPSTANTFMFYRIVWPQALANVCFSTWQQIKSHFTYSIQTLHSRYSQVFTVIIH